MYTMCNYEAVRSEKEYHHGVRGIRILTS